MESSLGTITLACDGYGNYYNVVRSSYYAQDFFFIFFFFGGGGGNLGRLMRVSIEGPALPAASRF